MGYNEADTRAKLIDPTLHTVGWNENLIRRETTAGTIENINGKIIRKKGRTDYLLCLPSFLGENNLPVAVVEAKKEDEHPTMGLEQAKSYAKRLNIPFVFATNGHLFVKHDVFTDLVSDPISLEKFPSPEILKQAYENGKGIDLDIIESKSLFMPYKGGQSVRRYYQDAAIRAALEKMNSNKKDRNRVLLSLATGAGKTRIAVHLLEKLEKAGQLKKVLFVCDRNELKKQGYGAMFSMFEDNVRMVSKEKPNKNARILVATYQSLGLDGEDEDGGKMFLKNFPKDYFSHIIIDECHRSAWNKWSIVLTNNPNAVQIGLTATPRIIETKEGEDLSKDQDITNNNIAYFGEPVYEYPYAQGYEDGYLAACEIIKRPVDLDENELSKEDVLKRNAKDALTGKVLKEDELKYGYTKTDFDKKIILPDRRKAMCKDLFDLFEKTGGVKQKTIIFCANDKHAEDIANELNNLFVEKKYPKCEKFAFKFTDKTFKNGGIGENRDALIANMRGQKNSHYIATTVDLLSTGIDIPNIQNIVFFAYQTSPILFYQMVGRGTRIDEPNNKYMFRIYDYTNATRLFGKSFITKPKKEPTKPYKPSGKKKNIAVVQGFEVKITDGGTFILMRDKNTGKEKPTSIEEYKQDLAKSLIETTSENINLLRELWIKPQDRRHILDALPGGEKGALMLREILHLEDCDLYDFFADLAFGVSPKTRAERVLSFDYKNKTWLMSLPSDTSKVVKAIARQFEINGISELESENLFDVGDVRSAGGIVSLAKLSEDVGATLLDIKKRLYAA